MTESSFPHMQGRRVQFTHLQSAPINRDTHTLTSPSTPFTYSSNPQPYPPPPSLSSCDTSSTVQTVLDRGQDRATLPRTKVKNVHLDKILSDLGKLATHRSHFEDVASRILGRVESADSRQALHGQLCQVKEAQSRLLSMFTSEYEKQQGLYVQSIGKKLESYKASSSDRHHIVNMV